MAACCNTHEVSRWQSSRAAPPLTKPAVSIFGTAQPGESWHRGCLTSVCFHRLRQTLQFRLRQSFLLPSVCLRRNKKSCEGNLGNEECAYHATCQQTDFLVIKRVQAPDYCSWMSAKCAFSHTRTQTFNQCIPLQGCWTPLTDGCGQRRFPPVWLCDCRRTKSSPTAAEA